MAATRKSAEITSLTGLRGVTALFVMSFHFFRASDSGWGLQTLVNHGQLGVDIFFMLSGFVLMLSYGSTFSVRLTPATYFTFVIRRFARIYPVYLLGVVVLAAITYLGLNAEKVPVNGRVLMANLLMIQNWAQHQSYDPPTWSVVTECMVYLGFPILALGARRLRGFGLVAASTGLLLASVLAELYPAYAGWADMSVTAGFQGLTRCLTGFGLGMVCYLFLDSRWIAWLTLSRFAVNVPFVALLALLADPNLHHYSILVIPLVIVTLTAPRAWGSRLLSTPMCVLLGIFRILSICYIGRSSAHSGW